MNVEELLTEIDRLAPFQLAESWDRVGLQVGSLGARVRRVLLTLDAGEEALDEARRLECDVVLAHHPLLFAPLETVTDDTFPGRTVMRALKDGRAVIAAHTNLDSARGGLGDIVCEALSLEGVAPLAPARPDWCKLVGFVPEGDAETVRKAVFAVGAGVVGDYIHCSFSSAGQGTFAPTEFARPSLGTVGHDQKTTELRVEVVFPRDLRRRVIDAFVDAHPYEEPAIDIYPVENELRSVGLGRVGYLQTQQPLAELAADVAGLFHLPSVRYSGDGTRRIQHVVVVPGSGGSLIEAAAAAGDVLITGDVKYHEAEMALRLSLALIEVPHEVAESFALERWGERFGDLLAKKGVELTFFEQRRRIWQSSAHVETAEPARAEAVLAARNGDDHYELFVDGGARGNPGPAGIGARLISPEGDEVEVLSDHIGEATNNVAEYQAFVSGLEMALDHGVRKVTVFCDSELVVKQMSGEYRVRDALLKEFHEQARRLLHQFQEVDVKSIPRDQNALADRLVNEAIDRSLS